MTRRACLVIAVAACGSTPVERPAAAVAQPAAQQPRPAAPEAAPVVDTTDRVPFSADERAAELAFLRDAIRDTYAHLDVKRAQWGVDLDALFARYGPRIRAADTWTRYESAMVGFVSELHDAHVAWRRKRAATEAKRRVVRLGLDTRLVAGELIVSDVWKGSSAEAAGLARGDRIVAIDGDPVEGRMAMLAAVRSASRAEAAAYDFAEQWPASRIPADAPPRERQITRERDGAVTTLRVTPETTGRPGGRPPAIELVRRGPIAVLRVHDLQGSTRKLIDTIAPLSTAIFASPHGLVVDLRGNDGGFEDNARALAAQLVAGDVTAGTTRVRLSQRAREAHRAWKDLVEDPDRRGWSVAQPLSVHGAATAAYPANIAVVIDAGCRSSCETLALLLHEAGGRLIGERTGGASGAPVTIMLPSSKATVTIPARAMYDRHGAPIEGHGVAPDDQVVGDRAAVAAGRDSALEAAIAWACQRQPPPCS
jgi:C-terminal processing protease CtpA/Prc